MSMHNKHEAQEDGFSLVELSIVLIIIGLLIGGVVKGQDIVESARFAGVTAQVQGYKKAVVTFKDAYMAFPGDMVNATTLLPGCIGNTTCENGNGNGVINYDDGSFGVGIGWNDKLVSGAGSSSESVQFWKHLAAADLISGVFVDFDPDVDAWAWEESHPKSAFGKGGFEIMYDTSTASAYKAHFLRYSLVIGASGMSGLKVWTSEQALKYDLKYDDGLAWDGDFVVDYGNADNDCHNYNDYKLSSKGVTCVAFWIFNP